MIQEIHYIGFIRIDDKEIIELIIQNHKKNLLKILYRMINYQRDSESRVEYIDNK